MEKVVVTEMNDIENTTENVIERKTATKPPSSKVGRTRDSREN